jgi:hypothetical protein
VPLFVVALVYLKSKDRRLALRVYLVLIATMLVDLDHLIADPIYDPNRCSIGFHPLHMEFMMPVYALMSLFPKTRWIGVGLLIHMGLDAADCM